MFFKEITKIPRESGNEKEISNYLCEFARKRKLFYEQDKYSNVYIKKKTSNRKPIILQAHMDMVCEKDKKKEFNFKKDSISLKEENGYLMADGTTLGADNGIGVAQILNVLDSDIPCNIEAIFTTSEETSMCGAINFDISKTEGKYMINLDGFEENTIIIGSACFYDIIMKYPYTLRTYKNDCSFNNISIELTGLLGGHSGFDIDKGRGNASILLAELLKTISNEEYIFLSDFSGGTKFNVIPSNAKCSFYTKLSIDKLKKIIKRFEKDNKEKYPNLEINLKEIENVEEYKEEIKYLNKEETNQFIKLVLNAIHGVYCKYCGFTTTSVNLGVVDLRNSVIKIGMRSSKKEEEKECLNKLKKYAKQYNLEFEILGSQPGFETLESSKIIKKLLETRPKQYVLEKTDVKPVHITVESGFFKEKNPDLEIAIISPKILGAHTPKECVSLESIKLTDEWIKKLIEEF